jgi:hypothetical protein
VGYVIVGAAILLAAAVYAGSCWMWPFTHCPRCQGAGKLHREDRKVFRLCRRCSGSGRRLRVGRRVWEFFAARRRAVR